MNFLLIVTSLFIVETSCSSNIIDRSEPLFSNEEINLEYDYQSKQYDCETYLRYKNLTDE